ncbi:MAG: RnfABCDGE type electron transport complex subunit D [Bacilli bacterium]|nr:RnfABCDGE type electron transport complex subunit D [Bacilli bacterium]
MTNYLKSKYSNISIITKYYIIILLLTIYATYKNGILLYQKELINFISILKPAFLVLLAIFIPFIISYIYYKYLKKEEYHILNDYNLVLFPLVAFALPLQINIFLYIGIILLFSIIKMAFKTNIINYYALMKLVIMFIIYLLGKYSYLTIYDLNIETNYTTLDMFLGNGIGGIATTNIALLIICYLILCITKSYKKEIPIISLVSFFIILLLSCLIFKNNIILDIKELITSEFIYGIIFISTISFYSPIESKKKIIYAILVGVLSYLFNKIINPFEGIFFAIIVTNLIIFLYEIIEKRMKNEHK